MVGLIFCLSLYLITNYITSLRMSIRNLRRP